MSRTVGRVSGLWRYPVKSMGGEPLPEVDVSWNGLAGDRRWAFVRDGMAHSGFPWLTMRERSDLGQFRPAFVDPRRPDGSPVRVRTPAGEERDVLDPALAAELGAGVRVMRQDRGIFDTLPLSLITTGSLAGLGALVGAPLDVRRFRPNVLVEADGSFPEDGWVGAVLRIGSLSLRVDKRDQRCAVVTVDPTTSERDASVLRALASERQSCIGVYGSITAPGRVAIGDAVVLEA